MYAVQFFQMNQMHSTNGTIRTENDSTNGTGRTKADLSIFKSCKVAAHKLMESLIN